MSWRREVEALVGTPDATPAVVVKLGGGEVQCHLVPRASSTVGLVDRTAVRPPATATLRSPATMLPIRDDAIAWIGVSFLGDPSPPAVRRALLAELARVLAPAGTLVVVDHNRPRRRLAAIAAVAMSPRPPGATPAAAWRRLGYPVAREAHAAGFVVDRLRLAAGERVQVISARRART
jgi:SAM-dependent methyltransferase